MTRLTRNVLAPLIVTALVACAGDADSGDATAGADLTADSAVVAAPPAAVPAATAEGLLDPENASREELMAIPGMTAALADSLVARRPFETMLEVDSVLAGQLSEAQRDSVYARLWKRIDLNTASEEEILLIPGIGERMLHEFEEYRPYTAIEQFRREMGKYVDDEEVARMEQYVEVR